MTDFEAARRRLRVGCEFVHELPWPVAMVLQVEPRLDAEQEVIDASLVTVPEVPITRHVDLYGNQCRRLVLGPGRASIRYQADVMVPPTTDAVDERAVEHRAADLPDSVLHFTLPSRYCESDRLGNTAWRLFGDVQPGWGRVQAVMDWVHQNIRFAHGSSSPATSATDVYLQREGVCRDFTQLAVSFLRALNVPARYCFGYLPDIDVAPPDEPMDFAAWLEAYLGDRWYTFDPRNNQRRTGRVVIGRGRDALDIAMLTSYGRAPLSAMRVVAEPAEAEPWSSAQPPVFGAFPTPAPVAGPAPTAATAAADPASAFMQ